MSRLVVAFCARCAGEKRSRGPYRLGSFDGTVWRPTPDRRIARRHRHTITLMQARKRADLELGAAQHGWFDHTPATVQHAEWMGWFHACCPEHGDLRIPPADLVRVYRTGQRKILLPLSAP
jgi:hypothetical protein